MADVANKKLLENDRVIVWEMLLQPGESTGMHTHKHDYIIQVIEGAVLRADSDDGSTIDLEFETDQTYFVTVRNGKVFLGDASASATHNATNISKHRYREILTELK